MFWGVAKAVAAWHEIISSYGQSAAITLSLIKVIDAFLIAIVLYLLAASIYTLFVGKLELPSRLVASNLQELKNKLSGIIVLVIAVRFVESLFEGNLQPLEIMWLAMATAAVTAALVMFCHFTHKDEKNDE